MTEKFDLVVIGGGPAGYAAAMRALDFGKKTLLVEKKKVGGAGIYDGALTSKTLWEVSREAHALQRRAGKYGSTYQAQPYQEIKNEVLEAIYERKSHLEHHLFWLKGHDNQGLFHYANAKGRLTDPHHVVLTYPDGRSHTVETDYVVLATGSRPRHLPHIPIDEKVILTSDGIRNLETYPESLVVIGAGVIGCEFTSIFANFGQTQVHLLTKDTRILPFEDPDVTRVIEENMERSGVILHRHAELKEMKVVEGRVHFQICYHNDRCEWFDAEKALISIGRVPNLEEVGAIELGIKLNSRGFIEDDDTQTSIPNIYAVGDLTADIALVNVGELEGRHAVERIFGGPRPPLRYDNISTIMFLNPETAAVGLNETQAKAQGLNYRVVSLDYSCIARAVAMRNTQGFFKILVTDDEHMRVLGMRALGEHASSAIQAVALLMAMDQGIEQLAEIIHPHPSIIEGIQEAMRILLRKPIFRPTDSLQEYIRAQVVRGETVERISW